MTELRKPRVKGFRCQAVSRQQQGCWGWELRPKVTLRLLQLPGPLLHPGLQPRENVMKVEWGPQTYLSLGFFSPASSPVTFLSVSVAFGPRCAYLQASMAYKLFFRILES